MRDLAPLPPPESVIGQPLFKIFRRRRSAREFSPRQLEWSQIGALLWAGQGETDQRRRLRSAPSAGALYPLELDVVTPTGLFRYRIEHHAAERRDTLDVRSHLSIAALGQSSLVEAACVIAISAVPSRMLEKYGERGMRYVHLEAGHAAENILLTASSLGLAAVPIGAFRDADVHATLHLGAHEVPLYLLPVGWPKAQDAQERE